MASQDIDHTVLLRVRALIGNHLSRAEGATRQADDADLEVDSMTMVNILLDIEGQFVTVIPPESLNQINFRSILSIAALLTSLS